jgi:hypothetical protein
VRDLEEVSCGFSFFVGFFDGEEAQGQWADKNSIQWTKTNNTFGSREMAASMALSYLGNLRTSKP